MLKKLLIASAILAATSTGAFAYGTWGSGIPYVGASISNETITASSASYRGFTGNLSVGYGAMIYPCVYLAGELFGIPGSATYTDRHNFTPSTKGTWGWGGSLNPGWYVNDKTMIYGRVGGQQRHFSGPNRTKGAWLVGVGLQTNVMPNWDVRGEYVYSQYSRISSIGRPLVDTINAGLVYKIT